MKNKMEKIGNIYAAGVYGMREKDSKKYLYIGSGAEINDALSRHLFFLKRGLYSDTNKAILQEKYDMGVLVFEVIHESEPADVVREMTTEQKDDLQKALSVLEEVYIGLYKKSVCNCQMTVTKHSSNRDEFTAIKRHNSNVGTNNPNTKYQEEHICNVIWLKENGFKNMKINKIMNKECNVDISSNYIYQIGNTKWVHLKGKHEEWMNKYIN